MGFGALGFGFGGELIFVLPLARSVILGTWCGKKVLSHLSEERFRLMYRAVLTLLALRLLVSPWLS